MMGGWDQVCGLNNSHLLIDPDLGKHHGFGMSVG
jgi:hypothetical protein